MRRWVLLVAIAGGGCENEEPDLGIGQCPACANAMNCPAKQPGINPLQTCDTPGDECFYCSTVMRRFVCEGAGDSDGDLRWRDNGVPEMCPPPTMGTSGTG